MFCFDNSTFIILHTVRKFLTLLSSFLIGHLFCLCVCASKLIWGECGASHCNQCDFVAYVQKCVKWSSCHLEW